MIGHAEEPVDLQGAYVLDTVGALDGREAAVVDAIDALFDKNGIKLFIVYVDSFEGTASGDWANATAELNGFGNNDVLLAVATEDRNFLVSYPEPFALSAAQTNAIENDRVVPALRKDDWAGAAIAMAKGLAGDTAGGGSAGGFPWIPVGALVVVGGGGALIYSRSRRKAKNGAAKAATDQKSLDQQAGRLLVQLDDALKTSEQELGFAVAQFGEAATAPFSEALAGAQKKVSSAFELRQRLDDAFPETPEEKRALTEQIIELCTSADAELDAQAAAFDQLRELEKSAPEALAAARTTTTEQRGRVTAATATLTALQKDYAASALTAIADNPAQATKLLDFAESSAHETEKALAAGDASAAAVHVRAAQQSNGQADQLLAAIDTVGADLRHASAQLQAVLDDTRQDLAAARALAPESNAGLASAIAAADAAITNAERHRDPLAALTGLQDANGKLDVILASVRSEQERVQRAASSLDAAFSSAQARISAANDYVTTRRGGIGETARTRLSEATRRLAAGVAIAATDPVGALREAQSASTLADDAIRFARAEVDSWQPRPDYSDAGYEGAGYDGASLGGLLGELLGGGGYRGGSGGGSGGWFGGSGSGSGWGGGNRSSSRSSSTWGGGSRSSSFGGGSRRSSGGSSGGRRSSGGRF